MNSALKPAGVPPSPVQQPLNKPLLQQNTPTYGQPMSHIPQNLVNIPHSTPPANAHSNNMHSTNHYSITTSAVSQHFGVSGSVPPPSNHPVANINQSSSSPTKLITHSSNNVAHLYKVPVTPPTPSNNALTPEVNAIVEDSTQDKPQSNGTSPEKPLIQESPKNHQTEPNITDKPVTQPQPQASVPEKPSEPIEAPPPEKPVVLDTPVTPSETAKQSSGVVEVIPTPESTAPSTPPKIESLPESTTVATPSPVSKPIVTPAPPLESNTASTDVATINTASEPPLHIEKVADVGTAPSLPEAAEAPKALESPKPAEAPGESAPPSIKQASTSNVSLPANKPKEQVIAKPTLKLATTHKIPVRKIKPPPQEAIEPPPKPTKAEIKPATQKSTGLVAKNQRTRTRTQPYQCPLPEVEMISKISASASTSKIKTSDDKLIVFYKNEFLAVRNPEGGFYICQALHNIFKSTRKLRILWLSQDKTDGDIYTPDFYDQTDFDCILTNCKLTRVTKGKFKLPSAERIRTDSILKRALAVEKGDATPCPTEGHPDGLDLSLYKEEGQLKKRRGRKRKASPLKSRRSSQADKAPDQAKLRRVEPKRRPPPVTKALVIRKALGVKAKETPVTIPAKSVKSKVADVEVVSAPVVDQKKAKVVAKVVKKPVAAVPTTSQVPVTSAKPTRKSSTQSVDTVVPFLRKDPPILKKEVPVKQFLVLKKESALKKEAPSKKEVPVKKSPDALKKDAPAIRKEMPVLKKEAPIVKPEVSVQKPVLTRKSSRGKK